MSHTIESWCLRIENGVRIHANQCSYFRHKVDGDFKCQIQASGHLVGGRLGMGLGNGLKRVSAMSIMFLSLKKLVVNMIDINGKYDKI